MLAQMCAGPSTLRLTTIEALLLRPKQLVDDGAEWRTAIRVVSDRRSLQEVDAALNERTRVTLTCGQYRSHNPRRAGLNMNLVTCDEHPAHDGWGVLASLKFECVLMSESATIKRLVMVGAAMS